MGLTGTDRVRVNVVSSSSQDALVVNIYRDVDGTTFVYEGDHGGLWVRLFPGEVHRPSYTFPGLVAKSLTEAFTDYTGTAAALVELHSFRLRAGAAEEALKLANETNRRLVDIIDNLAVAARQMA